MEKRYGIALSSGQRIFKGKGREVILHHKHPERRERKGMRRMRLKKVKRVGVEGLCSAAHKRKEEE